MKTPLVLLILALLFLPEAQAVDARDSDSPKGALPEIRLNGSNEDQNQVKAVQTEVMISKTENEALTSLKKIIEKRKGQPEETSLWNRLAELYMRRAKSGRFFDLYRDSDSAARFVAPLIRSQSASQYLRDAIAIYERIEKQWPKFEEMDSVLFNCAFAHQQLNEISKAENKYNKLVNQFPNSPLLPDAELALGEMNYDAHRLNPALEHFKAVEKYPKARVYSYGLYKAAWTLYNLKQNEKAIEKLIKVVRYFEPGNLTDSRINHNLRMEAVRDLGLFFGDAYTADKAYSFFSGLCTTEEMGDVMLNLTHLYQSHSRDKEVAIFLPEFIAHHSEHPARISVELALCESYEATKTRTKVIEHLEEVSRLCEPSSKYRAINQKSVAQTCDIDFPKTNMELTKKWWDIWQKNKQNKDIVAYTVKAFEIRLQHDDPKKPDAKSRFAYAELLYQLGDYSHASEQYELVSNSTLDTVILHDSSYAALVSAEKSAAKDSGKDKQNIIRLSEKYLAKNPHGMNAAQVKFKIGFTYYEMTKFNEAEAWLKPLAMTTTTDKTSLEFKRKAEDLEMDILNSRKDYSQIFSLASELLKSKQDPARIAELERILEEAKFANVQADLSTAKNEEQKWQISKKLSQFSSDHSNSSLAKDALWQSLSIAFATGHSVEAADMSLQYVHQYPKEAKNKETLKEAAKTYADNGFLPEAATTLQTLSQMSEGKEKIQYIEATVDLFTLMGKEELARKELNRLLTDNSKENQSRVYTQILATFKGKENSSEYKSIENKILNTGVEPYHSLMQVKLSESLIAQRKWVEAFNSTKSIINNTSGSKDARARAHVVRGRVLEQELVTQSLKTNLEHLSLVLSLKAEKLDKAQQAYSLGEKLAEKPETQLQALMGLSRIYQNFISSVSSPTLKTELKPEESKALHVELTKILKPVTERFDEIQKRISSVSSLATNVHGQQENEYLSTPSSETIKPRAKLSSNIQFSIYIPDALTVGSNEKWQRYEGSKQETCVINASDLSKEFSALVKLAHSCAVKKSWHNLQKVAEQMVKVSVKDPQGLFYMALAASGNNESAKAIWLYDLALKKDSSNPVLHFNKARELLQNDQPTVALNEFVEINDKRFVAEEIQVIEALNDYDKGDCLTAGELLNQLDNKKQKIFKIIPILAECTSIKGEPDQAIQILKKDLKEKVQQPELWLELARLQEIFKFDKQEAQTAYQSASQYSNDEDLKNWVKRKIDYLNGKVSVTVLNTQHVGTKDRDSGTMGGSNEN